MKCSFKEHSEYVYQYEGIKTLIYIMDEKSERKSLMKKLFTNFKQFNQLYISTYQEMYNTIELLFVLVQMTKNLLFDTNFNNYFFS